MLKQEFCLGSTKLETHYNYTVVSQFPTCWRYCSPAPNHQCCLLSTNSSNLLIFSEYHGVYSLLQLPGVKYIIIGESLSHDTTKWRETMFTDCSVVKLVSVLYFVCMGAWGVFLVAAIMACVVAHAGSVCAHVVSLFIFSCDPSAVYLRQWIGSTLVQIMACRLFGTKPLSKPMLGYSLLTSYEQTSVKF